MTSSLSPAQLDEACSLLADGGLPVLQLLSLQSKLRSGAFHAVLKRSRADAAVVVFDERGDWRHVVASHGAQPALVAAMKELRDRSEGMIWDEGVVSLEPSALDELGFSLVERQSFTQDLLRVPLEHAEHPELEVMVLGEAERESARQLFATSHVMTVAGWYSTLPHPPTLERCLIAFDEYMSGGQGEVVPSACVVTKLAGKIVGVICCAKTEQEDTGYLLGLGVDPAGRGKGLSRILVRRAQRALKEAGFSKMGFSTTNGNLPVHRLFTPEEILETETWQARLWLRNVPVRTVKPG